MLIDAEVINSRVAQIKIQMEYENISDETIDAMFIFPKNKTEF